MKRVSVLFTLLAAFSLLTASATQAAVVEKATGSIVMSGPKQAIDFAVFEDPMKGSLTYTNFEYADPSSGVWVPGGTFNVSFEYLGLCQGNCVHTLTVTDFQPLSPTSVTFDGTGFYAPTPTWTETFTGKILGNHIEMRLVPDDGGLLYGWTWTSLDGTVAADGSISGTWSDSLGRTGTFGIAAGAVAEVFSFTTTPTCVKVNPDLDKAKFGYTVPAGAPAELVGLDVIVKVFDGGSPGAGNDTYRHGAGDCEGALWLQEYPIVAGNLVVHG